MLAQNEIQAKGSQQVQEVIVVDRARQVQKLRGEGDDRQRQQPAIRAIREQQTEDRVADQDGTGSKRY